MSQICVRLDGIPLAIELAAARLRLLTPQALLARLDHRLALLTSGARDQPSRHQTLRNTLAWSYDLLEPDEQALFRRLGVFVGGNSLEAAEAICMLDESERSVLDQMAGLVQKSLVRPLASAESEPRFAMLETIREFAVELLEASGEATIVRERHATFFLEMAENARAYLLSQDQLPWLDRLETDDDNFRSALTWSQMQANAAELGLRMTSALAWYWILHSNLSEGLRWMEASLTRDGASEHTLWRAQALLGAGIMPLPSGNYRAGGAFLAESADLATELEDKAGLGRALTFLGVATLFQRDLAKAAALQTRSVALFRDSGDEWGLAFATNQLGAVARERGDYLEACTLGEEAVALVRKTGERCGLGLALLNLSRSLLRAGDSVGAEVRYREALRASRELGMTWIMAQCLVGLGNITCHRGDHRGAAQLVAAAEALLMTFGGSLQPADQPDYETTLAVAREALGQNTFTDCWEEAKSTPGSVIENALRDSTVM